MTTSTSNAPNVNALASCVPTIRYFVLACLATEMLNSAPNLFVRSFLRQPDLFVVSSTFCLRDYMRITGVSKHTAAQHVAKMVDLGITRFHSMEGQTHRYTWPRVVL